METETSHEAGQSPIKWSIEVIIRICAATQNPASGGVLRPTRRIVAKTEVCQNFAFSLFGLLPVKR